MDLRKLIIKILGSSREATNLAEHIRQHKDAPTKQQDSLYRVQEGDTWFLIAHRFYGNANFEKKIKDANPDISTDDLSPDTIIKIP